MLGNRSLVALAVVTIALAACSRKPEPVTPTPPPGGATTTTTTPTTRDTAGEGARRAEEERRRAEEANRGAAAIRTELMGDGFLRLRRGNHQQ